MIDTQAVPARSELPTTFTWDLTTVYADDAAWERDIARLEALAARAAALEGTIAQNPAALLAALRLRDEVDSLLWQIYVYASLRRDSDSGDPAGQALAERAGSLVARVSAALSFVDPEIVALPEGTLAAWQGDEPALQAYGYALDQLERQRAHVRSAEVESILAQYGDITRAPGEIFEALTDVDLQFPTIKDERGQPLQLSHARFGRLMQSSDRRVRRDAFFGTYSAYGGIRNTIGTSLAAHVRGHVLNARVRGYSSALHAALGPSDLPTEVYHTLISTIHANLGRMHRYMELRKRILGLDELHFYDLYCPLVPQADVEIPYDEAARLVQDAFAPLGPEYGQVVRQAFDSRWIDVYENAGKRSGAYSGGSYTTAPFILLNYQGRLYDAMTLAHELGHALHSFFTRKTQPFVYGHYTTFLAEVASTLNERLLTEYLLQTRDDEALRRHLLVQQLEDIRTTIFRQTMFAEFELDMHQRAEADEPLTADSLCQRYLELVGRYHGPALVLDDEIALEWGRIPHFYANFYVFQYATGLSASLALHRALLDEGQPAVDRYLHFLGSGASRPSIDLLREAGVDMTTPAPIQAAMDRFDRLLDQLESFA